MIFSKIKFGHICSIMILVALLVFSYMFYLKEGNPPPLQQGQPLPPATKEEDSYNSRRDNAHLCVKEKCNKYKKNGQQTPEIKMSTIRIPGYWC